MTAFCVGEERGWLWSCSTPHTGLSHAVVLQSKVVRKTEQVILSSLVKESMVQAGQQLLPGHTAASDTARTNS